MPPKAAPRRAAPARKTESAAATTTGPNARPQNASEPQITTTAGGPGPGPLTRPGVQRLQSLKKRDPPSGSITPSARPTPLKGEPSKPTLKYQPRAVVRRSKEEREAIEKLEAERHRERLAEAAAKMRGRGGPFQRGGRGGAGRGRGRGGARFTVDSRHSSVSQRSQTRSVIDMGSRSVGYEGYSSDESDSGLRVDIDAINLSDNESDEENIKGKTLVKHVVRPEKGLRPVRVEWHEHKERVVSVNMESSTDKSAEVREKEKKDKEQDNALFVEQDKETTATPKTEPRIKEEPRDDDGINPAAVPLAGDDSMITDDGFLPEQTVKVRGRLTTEEIREREQESETPAPVDPRSLLRTNEDIEEYERHIRDLEEVKKLLAVEAKQPDKEPATATATAAGDKPEEDAEKTPEEEDASKDKLSGQLFLMQFPPMTPNLSEHGIGSRPEIESTEAASAGTTNANTNTDPSIKRERNGEEIVELGEEEQRAPESKPSPIVTATDRRLGAGRVGKLNVHASGRVTMNWGGISFELDRATAVGFLQEALVVSDDSPSSSADAMGEERKVWAMGQLSGKFTVTPNWEDIL